MRGARGRWAVGVLAVALLAGLVGLAADQRSMPPAEGDALSGPPAASHEGPLRLASFNIHSGRDAEGDFDLDRTAACLRGMHVVGLNEVRGAFPWQEGDQAALLGRKLNMAWLFAPTTRRWCRDDFGNGLLASIPVSYWRREPLAGTRGKGHRNTLLAHVEHRGRTIHVLVTHVDRVQDREAQLGVVIERFLALPEPAVLMGDLNTRADDVQLARLLARPDVHDALGEGGVKRAASRIDWIITRGLQTRAAGMIDRGASDHPLVWAEVE